MTEHFYGGTRINLPRSQVSTPQLHRGLRNGDSATSATKQATLIHVESHVHDVTCLQVTTSDFWLWRYPCRSSSISVYPIASPPFDNFPSRLWLPSFFLLNSLCVLLCFPGGFRPVWRDGSVPPECLEQNLWIAKGSHQQR